MARPMTAAERTALKAPHHVTHAKILIEHPAGGMVDVMDYLGTSRLKRAEWRESIDSAMMDGSLTLAAAHDGVSLLPYIGASPANRDAADAYEPFLRSGRRLQIWTATLLPDVVATPADFHLMVDGYVDDVQIPQDAKAITLTFRDLGAVLMDRDFEEPVTVSTEDGVLLEVALQQLVDAVLGPGAVSIYTPVAPGVTAGQWTPDVNRKLGEELRERAFQIGGDFRYRFDAAGNFRPTFYVPDRESTVVDETIGPAEYFVLPVLKSAIADVRNAVEVSYIDEGGARKSVVVVNQPSIDRYRRRYMKITEGADSAIRTEALATAVAQRAVHDLGEPFAEQQVQLRHWWPAQLGDYYEFEPNGTHYDTPQRLAVVAIQHTLEENGTARTVLSTRGTIAGAYKRWTRRETKGGPSNVLDAENNLFDVKWKKVNKTQALVTWKRGASVKHVYVYQWERPSGSEFPAPSSDDDPQRFAVGTDAVLVTMPPIGTQRFLQLEPRDDSYAVIGQVRRLIIDPKVALRPTIGGLEQEPGASGMFTDLRATIIDPEERGGVLAAWVNRGDPEEADPTGPPDGTLAIGATPATVTPADLWNLTGGGTAPLFDNIRVHQGKGKRIWLQFTNSEGIASELYPINLMTNGAIIDENGELVDGAIKRSLQFAQGLRLPDSFDTVPLTNQGEIIFVRADRRLYRWNAGSSVYEPDPTAAESIAAGMATIGALAVNSVRAEAVVAGAIQAIHMAIAVLSEISPDAGIIVAGVLQAIDGQTTINLNAQYDPELGVNDPVISHPAFTIYANGAATFSGTVAAERFIAAVLRAEGGLFTFGPGLIGGPGRFRWHREASNPGHYAEISGDYDFIDINADVVRINGAIPYPAPAAPPALAADATDLPSAITLVNDIKAKLIALDLAS